MACFFFVIILIVSEKLNRAIAALSGAIIIYFVLIFLEGLDFSVIVVLLFGSPEDDYVNLHSLILIIAMMIIVLISHDAGLFQFIAMKLIIFSKGDPIKLMITFCVITVMLSAILNNILTVIILIPLTITVSRILNIDPSPYILTQAVLVNIGGTFFSISSIPNILITTYAKISFLEFFLNVGIISIIVFLFTIILFILLYRKDLVISKEGAQILREFNIWNFVPNKILLIQCMIALVVLFSLFILVPPSLVSLDIIALTIAVVLTITSRLNPKDIITKIDLELIFYLLGIFVIAGALEIIGITTIIGMALSNIGGGDILIQTLLILWFSAFLSSCIDNIPITKVLIPVVNSMPENNNGYNNLKFYSLAIGANWGDNLTPLGDNILVVNIAEQNKRPIKIKQFLKLGLFTTIYQLAIVSLIFTLIFYFMIGLFITLTIVTAIFFIYLLRKISSKVLRNKIDNGLIKIKNFLIK